MLTCAQTHMEGNKNNQIVYNMRLTPNQYNYIL